MKRSNTSRRSDRRRRITCYRETTQPPRRKVQDWLDPNGPPAPPETPYIPTNMTDAPPTHTPQIILESLDNNDPMQHRAEPESAGGVSALLEGKMAKATSRSSPGSSQVSCCAGCHSGRCDPPRHWPTHQA
jgi:hypothetical protein